jgi:large subunit ribosomal protein L2
MAVRKFKPTTPGQRHKIMVPLRKLTARVPEKSLVYGKKSSGGRNSEGKMTMRYIGGGHRKMIRIVDFKRNKDGVPAVVKQSNTTRIVRLVSLCYFMLMEKKDILLLPMDCKLVRL